MLRKMLKQHHLVVLILLVLFSTRGAAIEIQLKAGFEIDKSYRHLAYPFQLSNGPLCFSSETNVIGKRSFMCSFDEGETVSSVEVAAPFCGGKGPIVDHRLVCPSVDKMVVKDGQVQFPSYVYTATTNGFSQSSGTDVTTLNFGDEEFSAKKIGFSGNIFSQSRNEYYQAVTVSSEEENYSVIFRSSDGLNWEYVSDLPFANSTRVVIFDRGASLGVANEVEEGVVEVSYSRDFGENWLPVKKFNSTTLPQSVVFPSGLVAESYPDRSSSSTSVNLYFPGVPGRGSISLLEYHNKFFAEKQIINSSTVFLSGIFPLSDSNAKRLIIFYEVCFTDRCHFFSLIFELNDSQEIKKKEQKEEERLRKKKEALKEEEVKRQRREKLKEERKKKMMEARKKFDEYDETFIETAKTFQEIDGEMIIVRENIEKEYIVFEKEKFLV